MRLGSGCTVPVCGSIQDVGDGWEHVESGFMMQRSCSYAGHASAPCLLIALDFNFTVMWVNVNGALCVGL